MPKPYKHIPKLVNVHHDAGVTLNRSLYETVLRELLLERAEHIIELYEGSGAAWRRVRCVPSSHRACILWL